MTRKSGFPSWPPVWTTTRQDANDRPTGEIGNLERAMMHELFNNKIFLFIEHQGRRYMGSMQFDAPQFCYQIYALLQAQVGLSIQEIGDLDVSHLL
jgi:hypothetical protein